MHNVHTTPGNIKILFLAYCHNIGVFDSFFLIHYCSRMIEKNCRGTIPVVSKIHHCNLPSQHWAKRMSMLNVVVMIAAVQGRSKCKDECRCALRSTSLSFSQAPEPLPL